MVDDERTPARSVHATDRITLAAPCACGSRTGLRVQVWRGGFLRSDCWSCPICGTVLYEWSLEAGVTVPRSGPAPVAVAESPRRPPAIAQAPGPVVQVAAASSPALTPAGQLSLFGGV